MFVHYLQIAYLQLTGHWLPDADDPTVQLICDIAAFALGLLGGAVCDEDSGLAALRHDMRHCGGLWLFAVGAIAPLTRPVPALIAAAGEQAMRRYCAFFTENHANAHTSRAYLRACRSFLNWCAEHGLRLENIRPRDVAAYVEAIGAALSAQSVRQSLAAVRMLFDWLVAGQVIAANPAGSVRGPQPAAEAGALFVLTAAQWRLLVDAIPTVMPRDLRDRALIATLTYTFARISAALALRVEDLRPSDTGWVLWLHERQGRRHGCPCHSDLLSALRRYIAAAGLAADGAGYLFRTSRGRNGETLSDLPMTQADAWRMIRRRALAAGITAPVGCHILRATGIATYLANGGTLETAQTLAGHRSPRTTKRYDRPREPSTDDEVERIRL